MAQSAEAKRKYRKVILTTVAGLLPLIVLIAVLIYTKLYGFRHALQELVDSETNGEYALHIGSTVVHPRKLSFNFSNVRIERNAWANANGVQAVHIPSFELKFGSFYSLFTEEFSIASLVVEEPQIELQAIPMRKDKAPENAMISQQIMKLYPAIESVLNRFNIESLKVIRASLSIDQKKDQPLRIDLIDLLIENWRMRDLSPQSQLKLNIEKQNVELGKANMQFSGIEYNFLRHHLIFRNFHIASADSISGSDVDISGESLLLRNLDYKDFSENLRYNLQRAEINRPVIDIRLKWKKNKRRKDIDHDMVTRILRQTLGECIVDSAIIRDARVHLELQKENDTIKVDLPDVDFRLHNFAVLREGNNFRLGEVDVNLNGSELTLSRSLAIKLGEVRFDRNHDLTLQKVTLYSPGARQPIASLGQVKVRYFNLMNLLFYNHLDANAVIADNGVLNISNLPRGKAHHAGDTTYHLAGLFLHTVALNNITINYADGNQRLSLEGLFLNATNVRYGTTGALEYTIDAIRSRRINYDNSSQNLIASGDAISLLGRRVLAGHLHIIKDSVTVDLTDVHAQTRSGKINRYRRWDHIAIARIDISGKLPVTTKDNGKGIRKEKIYLNTLAIKSIGIAVADRHTHVALRGTDIGMKDLTFGETISLPGAISGEFSDVRVDNGRTRLHAAHLSVDYPARASGTNIDLAFNQHAISANNMAIRMIRFDQDTWSVGHIVTRKFSLTRREHPFILSDSVVVNKLKWNTKDDPVMQEAEIFGPMIKVSERIRNSGEQRSSDTQRRERRSRFMPDKTVIHPGELELINGQKIKFGKWTADRAKGTMKGASISTSFKKMDVIARNITILDHNIMFDSIAINANKSWYHSNDVETSRIDGLFRGVTIRGFTLNNFLRTNQAKRLRVELDRFDLDVLRDKRLPDPPAINKSATLDGMLKLPDNFSLASLLIRDGDIEFRQISDKTGEEGFLYLDRIQANARFDSATSLLSLKAKTRLYGSGELNLDYQTKDESRFRLHVNAKNMDLTRLNDVLMPLQAVRIKSGMLRNFDMMVDADDDKSVGTSTITYDNLHLELFKHNTPDKKNLGSEMLTLLADGIILKHARENARAEITQERVKYKSVFHYWVTTTVDGAITAIRKGKRSKS